MAHHLVLGVHHVSSFIVSTVSFVARLRDATRFPILSSFLSVSIIRENFDKTSLVERSAKIPSTAIRKRKKKKRFLAD